MKRLRITVGNALALPIIGALLANRLAWAVTSWVETRARNEGWTHFDMDRALVAAGIKMTNWAYAEKGTK